MTPQQKKLLLIAVLLLLFAALKAAMILIWQQQQSGETHVPAAAECRPAAPQGCTLAPNHTVYLQGVGGHKTPFAAAAEVPPEVQSVSVSFEMDGMDMGFNRYGLTRIAGSRWRADNIYLPLCSAERHDWIAVWHIDGQRYRTPFQTRPQ